MHALEVGVSDSTRKDDGTTGARGGHLRLRVDARHKEQRPVISRLIHIGHFALRNVPVHTHTHAPIDAATAQCCTVVSCR